MIFITAGNLSSTIQIKSSEDTTHLIEIPRKSTEFSDIENKFLGDWVKPNTQGLRVEAIFSIRNQSLITISHIDPLLNLVESLSRKVGINKQGRSFQRLGQGIYFTPYSSKAHFYGHGGAKPLPTEAGRTCRMMFMTKVVLGNTWQPDRVSQNCRSPPAGHDSTWGRVGKVLIT
ncbi:hypothetical protein RirG_086280 [Rhizophagus irregularis DAOM 197198w]|uniref:PARP catalytic domain-containing protein n=1 Tax=Rhizophagus irregularis (strain DAOM 197198w) TaxID=1432141 RepID=A0A015LDH3_RHIIW|nr:hypothetical protein RirG_086280 [Rhizophagus irregularis DAOM 197198w]